VFAYVTTATDNRVMLIAPGDTPKPILTGIPRGAAGNRGVLSVDHRANCWSPPGTRATRPTRPTRTRWQAGLAHRHRRQAGRRQPDPDLADRGVRPLQPRWRVHVAGRHPGLGDRSGADRGRALPVAGGPSAGRPGVDVAGQAGVAGCAAFSTSVMIGMAAAGNVQSLALNKDGSFTGAPQVSLQGAQGFGRFSGMDIINDRGAMAGTINRDADGKPVSSDRPGGRHHQPAGGRRPGLISLESALERRRAGETGDEPGGRLPITGHVRHRLATEDDGPQGGRVGIQDDIGMVGRPLASWNRPASISAWKRSSAKRSSTPTRRSPASVGSNVTLRPASGRPRSVRRWGPPSIGCPTRQRAEDRLQGLTALGQLVDPGCSPADRACGAGRCPPAPVPAGAGTARSGSCRAGRG